MVALTINEIMDELKKLGICCPDELLSFSSEYEDYYREFRRKSSF